MDGNEVVIGAAHSMNEVQQLLDKLNALFTGSDYHAETSTEELQSMSGHKSKVYKIKIIRKG